MDVDEPHAVYERGIGILDSFLVSFIYNLTKNIECFCRAARFEVNIDALSGKEHGILHDEARATFTKFDGVALPNFGIVVNDDAAFVWGPFKFASKENFVAMAVFFEVMPDAIMREIG